ncbi:MAG: ABC transporter permease [Akkermansiaceae bacterium]|nr:ABC transporter permease [Akkermansiaceae bacterium]MCP5549618.1 ABC transporter permease [Akkermansiaceae bacterium]
MPFERLSGDFALWRLKRSVILGLKSLWLHKLRSMLTALGIVFGVASVIAMLAIGEGASHEAQEQIKNLGSQNVILESVKPTNSSTAGEEQRSLVLEYGLTYRDIEQIRNTIPGVNVVVPARRIKDFLWNLSISVDADILGTVSWYPEMRNRRLLKGRFFTEVEMKNRSNVCVLNQDLARKLFPLEESVGKDIRLQKSYYRVIGVIETKATGASEDAAAGKSGGGKGAKGKRSEASGGGAGGEDEEAAMEMMMPLETLVERFGEVLFKYRSGSFEAEKVDLHEVTVKIEDPAKVVSAAEGIRHVLERNHKNVDYKITVPLELLRRAERTKQIFNIVLGSIAAISLLVGGIGIMNIMLATVTERTREIGIRRALGAKQRDIVMQFLIETILLSGTGGVIGVAVGLAIPMAVTYFADMMTVIRVWAPAMAFTISVLTGVVFGIYPALRAASMNPVEALRHE